MDILRAMSILFVVIGHTTHFLPQKYYVQDISRFITFDGVSYFFVLSGFLIGGILIKALENKPATFRTLLNFWTRRWFRTLPNYYFVLILLLLVLPYSFFNPNTVVNKPNYFLFIQSFSFPHPDFFPEAWSLCIEEWFYLLVPSLIFLLVGVFRVKPKKSILTVAISVIIVVSLFRYYRFLNNPITSYNEWEMYFRKQVVTRLDSLMFGVVGAYFSFYYRTSWARNKKILLVIGVSILLIQRYFYLLVGDYGYGFYTCVISFSITSFGAFLLLPFLSEYKKGNGLIFKVITSISLISYSMYLLNLSPVQGFAVRGITKGLSGISLIFVNYIGTWAFTIFGSIVLYKYFEKPVMNMRERIK